MTDGVSISVEELLALRYQAKHLPLEQITKVKTSYIGGQASTLHGRGMDFAEVREYQPYYDDVRNIDWRVTARTGKPFTKLYQEERERPVFIVVDYGPSMFFGTRCCFKSVVAAKLASLFAWAATLHQDRVGGIIFSGKQAHEFQPRLGSKGVLPILKQLATQTTAKVATTATAGLNSTLTRLLRLTQSGSMVILISDFFHLDKSCESLMHKLAKYNDVINLQVYDVLEASPPPADYYTISNGKQFDSLNLHDKTLRRNYIDYFQQQHDQIRRISQNCAIPLLKFRTDDEVIHKLKRMLNTKQYAGEAYA
jgi:uncharacterized protein (DUF58 family)